MRKILERCPTCGADLEIAELRCTRCETQVRGRYRSCDFCRLTDEQSTFLRLFVQSRGNLTELEKRLGVSYPTVRAKLDEVIERLGPLDTTPPPEAYRPDRRAILEAIARGEMTPAEGTRLIAQLGVGE
ncbi:MAG TPA: DUF2089 domain-containing protein [Chloroflexota bacterium]|jgi:hypothetical protein|nr:DUF2089 domain-containing protein [Chloroflexota bacterium]